MDIKELATKYKLSKDDFWPLERKNKKTGELFTVAWIIKHDAVEKIMAIENIYVEDYEVLNSERDFCRMIVTCKKDKFGPGSMVEVNGVGDKPLSIQLTDSIKTIGEASKENCTSTYYGAMAEKRGIDRAVLKLINAYEYGIYSDTERDDFKQPEQEAPKKEAVKIDLATVKQLELIRAYLKTDEALIMEYMKKEFNKTMLPALTKDEASAVITLIKGDN